mmetsp:Transcript_31101/g.54627  ORF Transcript_31101/g.54627 Transcript_31101/m.54627 type:complete len:221 (-) Transcript_31101:28-690(-)
MRVRYNPAATREDNPQTYAFLRKHLFKSTSTRLDTPGNSIRAIRFSSFNSVLFRLVGKDHLYVARARHVRVDTTVGPVGPSAHLRSTVDLDVSDDKRFDLEAINLGIALGVGKKVQKELARLNRPAALGGPAVLLDLCLTANTSHVFAERNSILTIDHIAKVFLGTRKRKSLNGLSGLVRVLVVDTEVGPASFAGLRSVRWLYTVLSHFLSRHAQPSARK